MLGAGKAQVVVNADLEHRPESLQSLTYTGRRVPLTTTTHEPRRWSTRAAAIAGATTVTGTSRQRSTGNSNYTNKIDQTTYGVDKTSRRRQVSAGHGQQPERLGAGRQDRAGRRAAAAAVGRASARSATSRAATRSRSARSRSRQAAGGGRRPRRRRAMIGYAKYALVGLGAAGLPVLHLADAAQARARGLRRAADLAARARGAAPARRSRRSSSTPRRRPGSCSCERRSTSPSSRSRISSSATPTASPRRSASLDGRGLSARWPVELYQQPGGARQRRRRRSPASRSRLKGRKKAAVLLVSLGPETGRARSSSTCTTTRSSRSRWRWPSSQHVDPTSPRPSSRSWPRPCRPTTRSPPAASTTRARCSSGRSAPSAPPRSSAAWRP